MVVKYLIAGLLVLFCGPTFADEATIQKLLTQAMDDHREISARILTWTGEASLVSEAVISRPKRGNSPELETKIDELFKDGEGVVTMHREADVKFAVDATLDQAYSHFTYTGDATYENGRSKVRILVPKRASEGRKSIRTAEHFLRVDCDSRVTHVKTGVPVAHEGVRVVHRESRSTGDDALFSNVFDPRCMLVGGGHEFGELLRRLLEYYKKRLYDITLASEGGEYVFKWVMGERETGDRMTLILREFEQALLVAEFRLTRTASAPEISEKYQYALDASSSVIYPTYYQHSAQTGEFFNHRRTVRLGQVAFDHPIPAAHFTYAALDVEDGDQLYDKLQNSNSVFLGGVPVPPDVYMSTTMAAAVDPPLRRSRVLWANLLILLAAGTALAIYAIRNRVQPR